ncbi:MAG: deoxyribodipyrimidine photo-lyase, partial [Chthoniobacterales bacterium]
AIFFNRDPDPYGRAMEDKIRKLGVAVYDFKDIALHERDEVLSATNDPYRVFTPYSRTWIKHPKVEARGRIKKLVTLATLKGKSLPELEDWKIKPSGATLPEAGEKAARKRLTDFLGKKIADYGTQRNMLDDEGTSRISQDLRFGLISIREVFARCNKLANEVPAGPRSNIQKYITELIWREFYMQILWHHPEVLEEEFNPRFRDMKWPGTIQNLKRWQDAETGFPIIDAAMRELSQTGFMHNRARMIVAMFLTKDLHLDWRHGEKWFMQMLLDGEIASNNGGWQWSAGTGADAAPYFRIQNPWRQAATYDPDAAYVKRWLPELRDIPVKRLMEPAKETLVKGYPLPIVDHAEARERTLEMYSTARK